MITISNADSALKDYYLDVVNAHIDTKKVQEYIAE